ncbi:DUF5719 family protein [Leucobacter luti]|uniref:Large extracellular alpha-helical protein n=1 Tax=Leucobacter luti TaxID=340320 RepID=A0A4V3CYV3_9MICO|nr:DUF5719 family protein [Leucobacter luti]QYM75291.1 hypothetical protein K1X41_11635 [Leucobacter luti]TDP95568.1 hypothetical protein EDF62_0257 [Leucobacter luti]
MNERSRILRGSARAVTGLLIVAASATAVVLLSSVTLPSVTRAPEAIVVDTTQNTSRTLVCAGAFGVLGADSARPGTAIPLGAPAVTVAGDASGTTSLTRSEGGEGLPTVLAAPNDEPLAAAQVQAVVAEGLRGVTASACAEPLNEQWLIGGGSSLGISTTLSLGNPGAVPATVELAVFDENGAVDALQTAGVLVAAGTEQTVSLNGYAPDRERLAVRVVSTGAPVTASLGVGQSTGITPFAVSSVTRQTAPQTELVIPGLANVSDHEHGPSDVGEGDDFPVQLRVLAPGGETPEVRARAIDGKGVSTDLGSLTLEPNAIGELRIPVWPAGANAMVIESDAPIIAAALGSATEGKEHDYDWFTPAPQMGADTPVAAPVVSGGTLVLANSGETDADVQLVAASGKGKPSKATVPAGAAITVKAPADAVITSTEPLFAGVRYVQGGDIAGYPVLAPDPRDGELTVYTR